jgi:stalled ribosome alternative rescue factor ArfA
MANVTRYLWRERISNFKKGTGHFEIQTAKKTECPFIGILIV